MFFLFALLAASYCYASELLSFEGQRVIRVVPETNFHLQLLEMIREGSRYSADVDFWSEPSRIGAEVDIRIINGEHVPQILEDAGMTVTTFVENVQALVEEQYHRSPTAGYFEAYHPYEEILEWLKTTADKYPKLTTLFQIPGKTYEGRTQHGIKLTSPTKAEKPILFIDAAIHAREWISAATVTWMANQFLEDYGKDQTVTQILDNLEIIIVPVVNIDGYVYTWEKDRMWRKTRSPNKGSTCIGTDPNRNWDWHWSENGASSNPCSETYYGSAAFSEPCVNNLAKYLTSLKDRVKGYISFHSYSQLWLTPWGWTSKLPEDYAVQNALSKACVEALTAVHGTKYVYGPISTTIYPASGSSVDWAYGALGVVHSATPELRDTGRYGFLLPPDQIIPTGEETYAAVKVFAGNITGF